MAGRTRSRGTRALGRTTRAGTRWPELAAASADGSGSHIAIPTGQVSTGDPRTRATFRMLLLRGLLPAEAANLTAYLCGLPVGDSRWTIHEVNRLLFLRELNRTGRFGLADGDRPAA